MVFAEFQPSRFSPHLLRAYQRHQSMSFDVGRLKMFSSQWIIAQDWDLFFLSWIDNITLICHPLLHQPLAKQLTQKLWAFLCLGEFP
jgi:hypothetical protein